MDEEKVEITNEEREGIGMIQALLAFLGEDEPEAVSLVNWRELSETEKIFVRQTWKAVCQSDNEE